MPDWTKTNGPLLAASSDVDVMMAAFAQYCRKKGQFGWLGSLLKESQRWLLPFAGVCTAVGLSELTSRLEILPSDQFPPVSLIAHALLEEMRQEQFTLAILRTLEGWAMGLGLSILIALPLGAFIGASEQVYRSLRMIIEFLRPIPPVALLPLAVLLTGIGMATKVMLVTVACVWPVMMQVIYGVQSVDPVARDTLRSFRIGWLARVRYLVLPSAAPYLTTGVRIASSIALIVAVSTELVIGSPGLGAVINAAEIAGDYTVQYAYIVTAGVLGWLLSATFREIERRVLYWHETQRPRGEP